MLQEQLFDQPGTSSLPLATAEQEARLARAKELMPELAVVEPTPLEAAAGAPEEMELDDDESRLAELGILNYSQARTRANGKRSS